MSQVATSHWFDMNSLLHSLASHTEPDMDKFSSSMATDMMQANYKVSGLLFFAAVWLTRVRSA